VCKIEELPAYFQSDLEKYYMIDMAGMAMWSDGKIEMKKLTFT
jgi:hypothetical protein